MTPSFKLGDAVETNQKYKTITNNIHATYKKQLSSYECGNITDIKVVAFREAHIPNMVILTLDTGFRHNESMFQHLN